MIALILKNGWTSMAMALLSKEIKSRWGARRLRFWHCDPKTSIARQIGDQDVTKSRFFWQGWPHGKLLLSFKAVFNIAMYGVGTQEIALADSGRFYSRQMLLLLLI